MQRVVNGVKYYTFEFVAKAPNYTRHALSTVTLGNGERIQNVIIMAVNTLCRQTDVHTET